MFKKIIAVCILCLCFAGTVCADVWVDSYQRKDGTVVNGHWRSDPDGIKWNNKSYR